MADLVDQDLTGARLERVDLSGSTWRDCGLHRVTMRDVDIVDTTIEGHVRNLVINGIDVAVLVEAELDHRDPDRPKVLHPVGADGFREAWALAERRWTAAIDQARALDPALLHESVDGEWSFLQTLRHLAFAAQAWVGRGVLRLDGHWHPLALPSGGIHPGRGLPYDPEARPSLDEVLALRTSANDLVRQVLDVGSPGTELEFAL